MVPMMEPGSDLGKARPLPTVISLWPVNQDIWKLIPDICPNFKIPALEENILSLKAVAKLNIAVKFLATLKTHPAFWYFKGMSGVSVRTTFDL